MTLIGGGTGSFDAQSGRIEIPVTLHFDQSLNVPFVSADVDSSLALSTDGSGGMPLDRSSGTIALGASGTLTGSGLNPLAGADVVVVISGTIPLMSFVAERYVTRVIRRESVREG